MLRLRPVRSLLAGLVVLATVATAPLAAAENGLLETRESLYNNIFIFGDTDTVTMTFGQNKRYYTESSMKLSDPGALTVDYTRYMTLGIAYPPKVDYTFPSLAAFAQAFESAR